MYIKGDASITNCSFDHIGGNAIYLNGGHVNVYDCNFTNGNQAIILYGDENVGPYYSFMNIYNSNFINLRSGEYAGAIRNSGQLLLVNCSFINNSASIQQNNTHGGAIYVGSPVSDCKINAEFINNSAYQGGAIFFNGTTDNCVTLELTADESATLPKGSYSIELKITKNDLNKVLVHKQSAPLIIE